MANLNELGDSLIPQQQDFDLGSIIAQIFAQRFAPEANDPYIRDVNGQFYGEAQNQTETSNNDQTILN